MERLLGRREVLRLVPYSNRHLYRLEASGRFPPRLKLGPGKSGYRESDIEAWILSRPAVSSRDPEDEGSDS